MASSRRITRFINVGHVIDHWFILIFPTAVLGMSGEFGRPYGQMIALSTGGFIALGAGSLLAGWLGDRWSQRNMMAVFFLGIGAATLAAGFAETAWHLAAGLTAIGVFASIYHPVGTAMLVSHAERVGREIGVNGVWGNLGIAFAALATGAITHWLGWRWAFFLPGAAGMGIGVLYIALVSNEPNRRRDLKAREIPFPPAVLVRAFSVLALVTLSGALIFNAVTISLPKFFDERFPQLAGSELGIGLLVSAVYVLGAMSQLFVGRVIDRQPLKVAFLPLAVFQAPLLLLSAYASGWLTVAAAAGLMFVAFGQVTINDGMVAKYASSAWRARVYAVRYLLGFGMSASAVPLVAFMHDHGGFRPLFQLLAGFGALLFLGALFFPYRPDELARPERPSSRIAPIPAE